MMKENGGVITLGDDVWQFNPLLDKSDKKRIVRTCNDIVVETYSAKKEFWIS
jgi:hypothetical protein